MASKLLMTAGGIALSGATGLGIWKLSGSDLVETFRDRLKSEFKDTKWKVLDSKSAPEWVDIKEIYDLSSSQKIKKGESNLTSSELPDWCIGTLNKSYSEDSWESVKRYCLINTNSILQELGDKAIPVSDGHDSEWLEAWKLYDKEKVNNVNLQIEDSEIKAVNSDENKGKAAMKKWCETAYKKLMYKNGSVSDFSLAAKWCIKVVKQ
ncbi:hypothetical protein HF1_13690 [Mycoplasma haemofelis str. Langford 1]|uniref:Uncharacterized protein n=1 Tax=Mycoplasma haemofelis (strain Langford 1) TaxID=941640 RepID=E8ZJQ6_MYCHL|nr:hypothetical protein [Mycoplasma haemofelis]CBY93377.1 hypothetical protein HF1_13690 [Mycoplasma haemofelis str. Langford 1]